MTLPDPQCWIGYPIQQIWPIIGEERWAEFSDFMSGQTMSLCDGMRYDHALETWVDTCPIPHGAIVYVGDVKRFLAGLPVID